MSTPSGPRGGVPHRKGHDVFVAFEEAFFLGKSTKDLRDVIRDAWLLGNNEGFPTETHFPEGTS